MATAPEHATQFCFSGVRPASRRLSSHRLETVAYDAAQSSDQNLKVMLMPAISLALPLAAILMRNTRSAVLEELSSDHVRVARAKGLSQRTVLGRHVLRNASIPIITIVGIQIATLLGGTVIIERIFSLPGIGSYIVDGINNRDYAVVTSVTLVMSTIFVLVSLLVDILYAVMDPRLRKGT